MLVITARNVNYALAEAVILLKADGTRQTSRNGPVTKFTCPVTTLYKNPCERVLWNAERDANPFFHFFESLWMLAGQKDVKWISRFSKNIGQFSDDGKTFNGGYGYRWRNHFGKDQLSEIVANLSKDFNDRRCVIQMWDGHHDLSLESKDVPCNTSAYVFVNDIGQLCLTVSNRSNDLIWGCYGANAVHFSMLLEYLASRLGLPVGRYWQVSNNLHMYDFNAHQVSTVVEEYLEGVEYEPYTDKIVAPYPMFDSRENPKDWDVDLQMFMDQPQCFGYRHSFFSQVAKPLYYSYAAYSDKSNPDRFNTALEIADQCVASDWKLAARQWLQRRQAKSQQKKAA